MSKNGNQFETLLHDLDRVKRRQKVCKKHLNDNIKNVLNILQERVTKLNDAEIEEEDQSKLRNQIQELSTEVLKIKPLDHVTKSHKEYFVYLSKFGKDIDKSFNKDINNIFKDNKFSDEQINNVVQDHYLREGKFDVQVILKNELGLKGNEYIEHNFQVIYKILEEIRKQNLDPALQWALANEKLLEGIKSDLLFVLYQQKFIQEVVSKGKEEAIKYARINFQRFFPKYALEIQKLMGSLIYDHATQKSQYSYLYENDRWENIANEMISNTCKIHNTTPQSALSQILGAGTLALPKFLKFYSFSSSSSTPWSEDRELPVATDLGKEYQFHSVFVCPVTKEISTIENPPMLLNCGHVISEHALKKILSERIKNYKCPYCPAKISASSCQKLTLN